MKKHIFTFLFILLSPVVYAQTAEQATANYFVTIQEDPTRLARFLRAMPKGGDLHNHLGGASLAENMLAYAKNDSLCINKKTHVAWFYPNCSTDASVKYLPGYPVLYNATIDAWSMRHFQAGKESGHDHFFAVFGKYHAILTRHPGEMISEVVEHACQQNLLYLELMVTPDDNASGQLGAKIGWHANLPQLREKLLRNGVKDIVHTNITRLNQDEKILRASLQQQTKNKRYCSDFTLRYLYQVLREQPPEKVFAQLLTGFELANHDPRVVGINIVQAEDGKIAMRDYTQQMKMIAFLKKCYPNVRVSLHAGELVPSLVPKSGLRFHIRQAVEIAHADRIGHGVDIRYENHAEQLLKEMAKKHILVEINLSSNEAILGVKGAAHPIVLYRRYGVPVTLSTDDEGVLRTNLSEQYKKAVLTYHFSYKSLKTLIRNSLHYSFLPGKALWQDDHYQKVVPVCQSSLQSGVIPVPCQQFLNTNEKANLQWKLEVQFSIFERSFLKK